MNLWVSPVEFVRSCRSASRARALIDGQIRAEQKLFILWLGCRSESVGTNLESWSDYCGGLRCGFTLALSVGEDYREVRQEDGSGEEHPHHPALNKNGKDDANHSNDL